MIKFLTLHQDRIALVSAAVGANIGGYMFAKDDATKWFGSSSWILGSLIGAGGGLFFGYISPFAIPAVSVALPGYILANYHSSRQGLKPTGETLEAQKDLECQTKGARRE
jgi:hypothetical protein